MSARERYRSAAAFRTALEQRLRREAQDSGVALSRLRKEAAFSRLLVRLYRAAPAVWALKGGFALIARLGAQIRGTKDVDANWRVSHEELEEVLSALEDLDTDDWFTFEIADARTLRGEGEEGALRYPVTVKLDSRVFEQMSLDVNVVGPEDARPVELVKALRNPFEFIDEPSPRIPMVTPAQQLAEKLHAYTRLYADEPSNRAKDLFDMLVIAHQVPLPRGAVFTTAVEQTFAVRNTRWPTELAEAPRNWAQPWAGFVSDYPLPWEDLDSAFVALRRFWDPVLTGAALATDADWRPDGWQWTLPNSDADH